MNKTALFSLAAPVYILSPEHPYPRIFSALVGRLITCKDDEIAEEHVMIEVDSAVPVGSYADVTFVRPVNLVITRTALMAIQLSTESNGLALR